MELKLYLRMLQRSWWIAALTALAALNVALMTSYLATPLYRSSARFIISPNPAVAIGSDAIRSFDTLDRRSIASTYAEIFNSYRLLDETGAAIQLSPDELAEYTRSAVVLPESSVLELTVSGPHPEVVALLANSLGQRAIDYARSLNPVYEMSFLDPAATPSQAFSPQPLRDASLAVALGLVIGSVLAILREQLRIPLNALRQRSQLDSASSAYNRRFFERRLDDELSRGRSDAVSLGLVRLEGLQDVIDGMPPLVSQRLLKQVSQTLRNELRGHDIVARWDNITFAVLLPATGSLAATRTLERIQQALSRPVELDERDSLALLPHAGVATGRAHQPPKTLISRAQAALDKAQQNGSQIVPYAAEEMEPAASL